MQKQDTFNSWYKNLNTEQKLAVDSIDGPVMVVAGPGTGKTTILTLRIANILLKTDVQPENILALTFTNSGVHAMRKRLLELIGDEAYRVNIFTFHSFSEYIIKNFSFYFKNLEHAKAISDLEKVTILEEIIKEKKFKEIVSSFDPLISLNNIKSAIDSIKQEGLTPEEFKKLIPKWKEELLSDDKVYYSRKYKQYNVGDIKPAEEKKILDKIAKAEEIFIAYEAYQEKITDKRFYDFSDMILNVLKELEVNENLKLDLQEQFQYILVDEHQDTNDGQNRLIELLTDADHLESKPNIFTVGDEKQSIYRFQGASEKTFKHFLSIYRDVQIIKLKENYRSTEDILNSSHQLIVNTQADAQQLSTNKDLKEPVRLAEFSNYKFELLFVAEDILDKIKKGVSLDEISVIYRSNKHLDDLKDILTQKQIPHVVLSRENILEDINIRNLISLLKAIENPKDNHSVAKSLLINFLDIDPYLVVETLNSFNRESRNKNISLFKFISQKEEFSIFVNKIKDLKKLSDNSTFSVFFKEFLNEIGYIEYLLKSANSRDQLILLDKLLDEIKRQINSKKGYSLVDFIKFIDSCSKYNLEIETNDPEILSGVRLMTAHKSKGLEFEYVYIINATRRNLENNRGKAQISLPIENYKGDIDDERRLFYVAITRAKKGLCVSSSLTDWEGKEQDKSQFISEIENEEYTEKINTKDFEKSHIDEFHLFLNNSKKESNIWNIEYLKGLFLSKNISVTALNNYLSCPVKYFFRNLIQLPSAYTANQIFGNVFHGAMERFFLDSKEKGQILGCEYLEDLFKNNIDESSLYGDDYDRYLETGISIIKEYYFEYTSKWSINVELEKKIKRELVLDNGEKVTLSGILDKIEYIDSFGSGRINIFDYKTGKAFSEKSTKEQKDDLKRQIVFYHILLDSYEGDLMIEKATLDFVQKNKKGQFEQYTVNVSSDDKKEVLEQINNLAIDVFSGDLIKKGCGKRNCEYCQLLK